MPVCIEQGKLREMLAVVGMEYVIQINIDE